MSTWHDRDLDCPRCATRFVVRVATGLHISRLPAVREQVVRGELHRFRCPSCAQAIEVQQPLIYTDFARGHWIEVRPELDLARWRELAPACDATYRRAIERGAPMLRTLGELRVRLVFGYDELREKLVVWDAGLDDRAVEHAKLVAIRADPSVFGVADRLLVRAIDAARDELVVDRHRDGAVDKTFTLPRALVLAPTAPNPTTFPDPFVSLNREIGRFALG